MKSQIIMVKSMVIAAVYTGLTIILGVLSYGELQFRVSDAMLLLPLLPGFGMEAVLGLTLGGFLGNITSPFQPWDLIFGPLTNAVASALVFTIGRKISVRTIYKHVLSTLTASLVIALLVGYAELHLIYELPVITVLYVFISEIVVIGVIGWTVMKSLERYMTR
ncbi:QueT transporter family protein [Thermosphaera sp.]